MWDAAAGRKIRVAFVVGEYPPEERKRREDAALAYSSAEVEVGIVSVKMPPASLMRSVSSPEPPSTTIDATSARRKWKSIVPSPSASIAISSGGPAVRLSTIVSSPFEPSTCS